MCHPPHPGPPATTLSAPRIIGVGSPFGADRLGWEVAERMRSDRLLTIEPPPEILCCDRPGPRLLELLSGVNLAFILDAMSAGLAPGTVRCLTADELEGEDVRFSCHGFGLASTLALGRALRMLPPRLHVVGIEGGEGTMPDVRSAAESAARLIMALADGRRAG